MPGTHSLPPELTVYHVTALRAQMLEWIGSAPKRRRSARAVAALCVDASAVAEVDASGVQLLASLKRTLESRGRALSLESPSRAISRACGTMGLDALLNGTAGGEGA